MPVGFPNGWDLRNQRGVNVASPSTGTDVVNKDYVDNAVRGLDWKAEVIAASTTNVTIASPGSTIDGVTISAGMQVLPVLGTVTRILLKDQTTASENGIYDWNGAASPMTRSTDADSAEELSGSTVTVQRGTVNADRVYRVTTDVITLGTTSITFAQVGGGGDPTMGGDLTGTASNAQIAANAVGQAEIASGAVIASKLGTGAVKAYAETIGGSTSHVVTHNLGTTDVDVFVYDVTTKDREMPDVDVTSTNTVTIIFGVAPGAASKRIVVMGII
jgi:hypothetical protein